MVTKVHLDALMGEAASLQALLNRLGERDILNRMSLEARLKTIREEINSYKADHRTAADVALIFDGDPVQGSSSIDADFAGRSLLNYQELITKQVALAAGELAARGPIPQDARDAARMNVTSLVHGSFGFVLQEARADEPGLFDSPVKHAVEQVSDLLTEVTDASGVKFAERLQELDVRTFNALKKFVDGVYKANASFRIAERDRELKFDVSSLGRAYERLRDTDVSETEETIIGELLGLVPIQRRFELRRKDNGEVIQGRVSQMLSADYLERLEGEGIVAGREWRATIATRLVEHPDGRHMSVTHTLTDLVEG